MSEPIKMFDGDPRCLSLLDALTEVLHERGEGLPVPSILGVFELLKYQVIEGARNNLKR